ncbi:hypothetical protein MM326_18845 [Alkalihalobacillus sp. LMS6]|uniref:hypothetical protein n=1 Tax=Alkalihalobacillus sp. LMS6 TaxID=2924034 RepID=UPI0020D030CF|nr:hypothetical protein [Alkalihalobacillus sp. LMS6]UTR06110.1 hypothetical protein MM326_18845 [Alkalihalobacillus sp. LMS6]
MEVFMLWIALIVAIVFLAAILKKNQLRRKEDEKILAEVNAYRKKVEQSLEEIKADQKRLLEEIQDLKANKDHSNR